MARLVTDFYSGSDIYDDGDVEQELLDVYKGGDASLDLNDDRVFYLTTDIRANILNWYPFESGSSVLEIGTGCGTITELLCEKCAKVVGIEASKRRASITYYRHRQQENLTVYAGDFDKVKLDEKFDYIVLVGVFEYAKRFFNIEAPFDFFLERIKSLLKPGGKVLIAIENRYGVKYWAGCKEDHLHTSYIGLQGYSNTDIQTFGKVEFVDLIEKHGFMKHKFYYPFPDYKLPNVIYSDQYLPKNEDVMRIPIYPYGDHVQYTPQTVLDGLIENKKFDFFSNSFLVEFGLDDAKMSQVDFAKNHDYRKREYQIVTTYDGEHFVKTPAHKEATKHLDRIYYIYNLMRDRDIPTCDISIGGGRLFTCKVEGDGATDFIIRLAKERKWAQIDAELDNLVEFYHKISIKKHFQHPATRELDAIYGSDTHVLKLSLIDGNISNLIRTENGEFVFIDQEWLAEEEIPADYLIYFSLLHIFSNENLFPAKYVQEKYKQYGITSKKAEVFRRIEVDFYRNHRVINYAVKSKLDGCKTYTLGQEKGASPYLLDLYRLGETFGCDDEKFLPTFKRVVTNSFNSDSHYLKQEFLYHGSTSYLCFPQKDLSRNRKKSILLMIHELSRTGAPIVTLDAARMLVKNGYYVVVISPVDGPLRQEFLDLGVPVVISPELRYLQYYCNGVESFVSKLDLDVFVERFDEIIMVTATLYNFVRRYMNSGKRIVWWIHEGSVSYEIIGVRMPKYLTDNVRVFCGGHYAADQLTAYGLHYETEILNYGVDDEGRDLPLRKTNTDCIRFLVCGSLNSRKGQPLLLEAIKKLSNELSKKAKFTFIGCPTPGDPDSGDIKEQILDAAKTFGNVELLSPVSREKLFELYQQIDVLVVPSVDDPMPVVATETFMLRNICLCSDHTGTASYIEDGKNGFVFKSGDVDELVEKITYILEHTDQLDSIRLEGRKVYERVFEMQIFEKNLLAIVAGEQDR